MILRSAIDSLASVLFPAPCLICGQTLANASRIPICGLCLSEFERIADPLCACCGRPLVAPSPAAPGAEAPAEQRTELVCRLCRASFYAFDRARSFAIYNRALSEAILLLKYEQVTSLADWFGARLAQMAIDAAPAWKVGVIVPVPLHRDRRRERGYNQAELIARSVARRLKLRLDSDLLVRIKPRPPQLVLSRAEHWKSVRGAYDTREGMKIDNTRVLLVDDVFTTGATLDACSRALKKAGASKVFGLTVGRVRSGTAAAITMPAGEENPATKLNRKRIYKR
ncbi:MAG: ComF family protein [Acidobacteriota bacterium]|nr:ComF family protein [Acidobacteriota bacterium]